MALHPVYGHETLLNRLAGGIASSRFPQAALLTGPPGVGKQRLALWVAQALLCQRAPGGRPCDECDACSRVSRLAHPDLHWFIPIPRPKAQDPDKQVEEADQLLAEAITARREQPLYGRPEGMASHALASVRLLQRRIRLTPVLGRRKVVVLADAERLVVQEASPEAANALLKLLEEPAADTVVLLTAADPQALLPTVRSRLVPIRVSPLPDDVVRRFLEERAQVAAGPALARRVAAAAGSIGQALWSGQEADSAAQAAAAFLAALGKGAERRMAAALAQPPWSARGEYTALLDAVAVELRNRIAAAPLDGRAGHWARAIRRVEAARFDAQGNLNPQLGLAVLARDLEPLL